MSQKAHPCKVVSGSMTVLLFKMQICIWPSWCSSKSRLVLPSWFYLPGTGSPW